MTFWGIVKSILAMRSSECGYGNRLGAEGECKIIVQPGEGVRYGGTAFCSEDHAASDQQEAAF